MLFERCQKCGYDLSGLAPRTAPVLCPECGHTQTEIVSEAPVFSRAGAIALGAGLIPVVAGLVMTAYSKGWGEIYSIMRVLPASVIIGTIVVAAVRFGFAIRSRLADGEQGRGLGRKVLVCTIAGLVACSGVAAWFGTLIVTLRHP